MLGAVCCREAPLQHVGVVGKFELFGGEGAPGKTAAHQGVISEPRQAEREIDRDREWERKIERKGDGWREGKGARMRQRARERPRTDRGKERNR